MWGLVRNVERGASPLLHEKLWGWDPAIGILTSPPGYSGDCAHLRVIQYDDFLGEKLFIAHFWVVLDF